MVSVPGNKTFLNLSFLSEGVRKDHVLWNCTPLRSRIFAQWLVCSVFKHFTHFHLHVDYLGTITYSANPYNHHLWHRSCYSLCPSVGVNRLREIKSAAQDLTTGGCSRLHHGQMQLEGEVPHGATAHVTRLKEAPVASLCSDCQWKVAFKPQLGCSELETLGKPVWECWSQRI